jgi:hypothetical protein
VTSVDASGRPAKNRGLYFDGAKDGFVPIPNVLLHQSCAFHIWALLKSTTGPMTLFSKDRNAFTQTTDKNLLYLQVNASTKMEATLAKDNAPATTSAKAGSTTLSADTWYYFVFSFEMLANANTKVELFLDGSSEGTETWTDLFIVDGTNFGAYIGVERTAAAAYGSHWNGYVYEFVLYQDSDDPTSNTTHAATCTGVKCSTIDFEQYDDGAAKACAGTNCTDRSCVRDGVCQQSTDCDGFEFCHLCYDRECEHCLNYTNCETDKCLGTGNASEDGGACKCNPNFGRVDHNYDCKACKTGCLECDVGGQTTFADCTKCDDSTMFELPIGTHKFCANYCPSGHNEGNKPNCTPATAVVFTATFNTFVREWTTGTIKLGFDTNKETVPAKTRGNHFSGTD